SVKGASTMSSANPKRSEGSGRGLDALPGMMRQAGTRYEVRVRLAHYGYGSFHGLGCPNGT
ncbi:MAG: hypothetical protein ACLQVJ_07825, partial [Syntrophobacteraceae bacterium]